MIKNSGFVFSCFYATLSSHNVNFQKRVQYCVSGCLLTLHWTQFKFLLCSKACKHIYKFTAATDVTIDSTQAPSVPSPFRVVYQCCIYIYSIKQIVQFTNSNVMRESKLSVFEWHIKACTWKDMTFVWIWASVAASIHA